MGIKGILTYSSSAGLKPATFCPKNLWLVPLELKQELLLLYGSSRLL